MSMPIIAASDISRSQAVTDIIESVALEQTALSHIINAEGEKIQAVLALENVEADVLLNVNKSVQSMVDSITSLEMILQNKLRMFESCIDNYSDQCVILEDTSLTPVGENTPHATKIDKLNYTAKITKEKESLSYKLTTTPTVDVTVEHLPKDWEFANNIITANCAGELILKLSTGDCAQTFKFTVTNE